ncbi:MAG TPA: rRNA maturation RNase YbeY [bacterium]|nr:rRNA maturation RNase YbeY [bacterium]
MRVAVLVRTARPGIRPDRLRRVVRHVLRRAGAPQHAEITVALVTDAAIRRLNRRFLGRDRPTDVLAFPLGPRGSGDVAISVPRARVQARQAGHPVSVELALLAAHGALHLLGHDDRRPRQREAMMRRQRALLGELGIEVRG